MKKRVLMIMCILLLSSCAIKREHSKLPEIEATENKIVEITKQQSIETKKKERTSTNENIEENLYAASITERASINTNKSKSKENKDADKTKIKEPCTKNNESTKVPVKEEVKKEYDNSSIPTKEKDKECTQEENIPKENITVLPVYTLPENFTNFEGIHYEYYWTEKEAHSRFLELWDLRKDCRWHTVYFDDEETEYYELMWEE